MSPRDFDPWLLDPARRPLVMAILNVTPDSFSDGGQFATTETAVVHARDMIAEGADLLDVGGESTRPGSEPVPADEQIRRVVPVIEGLRDADIAISIDTTNADVAKAALDAGAAIVNDVSAARFDERMLPLVAKRGVPIVLMHMQGTPQTMHLSPHYDDVIAEVRQFLIERAQAAADAGVAAHRVLLDVGIGFGKTSDHNLSLLREYRAFTTLGHATLLGTSRKRFLGQISGATTPADRVWATAASVAWGVTHGASIVRVHDVGPMRQVVSVAAAIAHRAR